MTLATITENSLSIPSELGQAAKNTAELHVFEDWKSRRAQNTIRRAERELDDFALFLANIQNAEPLDLFSKSENWQGDTNELPGLPDSL